MRYGARVKPIRIGVIERVSLTRPSIVEVLVHREPFSSHQFIRGHLAAHQRVMPKVHAS
jgi:hypothetical protein